jgi:hypothetical protein
MQPTFFPCAPLICSWRRLRSAIPIAIVAASAVGSAASAAPPLAEMYFAVGRDDIKSESIAGIPLANGKQLYQATYADPDGGWSLVYNLFVDYTNDPKTSIFGTVKFTNTTLLPLEIECGVDVPICPAITEGSLIGGNVVVTLGTNGPGSLTCADADPMIQVMGDALPIYNVFFCPFTLATTGSGTLSSNNTFGLPGPNFPGPASLGLIGERQHLVVTGLDSVTIQVSLLFTDTNGAAASTCPADLNGDGFIDGNDIGELFQHWGETSFCPADLEGDLNEDGIVNKFDLLVLIQNWGACSE